MSRVISVLAVATCLLLVLVSCATGPAGRDLGGGFVLVTKQATEPGDNASPEHLYFRGSDLGRVDYASVSPSGEYALFARANEIFLIASATGNLKAVTDGGYSTPAQVSWHENEAYALVEYRDDRPSSRIDLK